MVPILSGCSMIACHKVPIQSLSLFVSITTTCWSLAPSATAAAPHEYFYQAGNRIAGADPRRDCYAMAY
jgi:hypothetical protein